MIAGALVFWMGKHDGNPSGGRRSELGQAYLVATCGWVGWQIAVRSASAPSEQLVWATSIAAAGCFALGFFFSKSATADLQDDTEFSGNPLTLVGVAWVIVSSAALLNDGWMPAVLKSERPDQFVTLSVAAWLTATIAASAWQAVRSRSENYGTLVAILVPAVVLLVSPLWEPVQWWTWFQSAAIASGILLFAVKYSGVGLNHLRDLSLVICTTTGVVTCAGVIGGLILRQQELTALHQPIGLAGSALAIGILLSWKHFAGTNQSTPAWLRLPIEFPWPATISLGSGHLAIAVNQITPTGIADRSVLPIIWTLVATVSIVEIVRRGLAEVSGNRIARWHAGVMVVASSLYCALNTSIPAREAIGLFACLVGGVLIAARVLTAYRLQSDGRPTSRTSTIVSRVFSWYVLFFGGAFVAQWVDAVSIGEAKIYTAVMVWLAAWAVIWRLACPDVSFKEHSGVRPRAMMADMELSWLVLIMLTAETAASFVFPNDVVSLGTFEDPMLWVRVLCGVAITTTVGFRHDRPAAIEGAMLTLMTLAVLLGIRVGIDRTAEPQTILTICGLAVAASYSIMVFGANTMRQPINWIVKSLPGITPGSQPPRGVGLARTFIALLRIAPLVSVVTAGSSVWLLVEFNATRIVPVAICGVALLAACLGELAERTRRGTVRHAAVITAIATVAMWASCNVAGASLPLVALTTRWFVAWVLLAATLAFAIPKLLRADMVSRWGDAFRSGWGLATALAAGSLVATLVQEAMIRVAGRTEFLDRPLFLGMAVTLAVISLACTLAGVLSGPGYVYQRAWKLTNRHRVALIVAAQVFGGLTWFHLFLCKSPLASLGLRAYWPYVVMTLSFASVGITEWARRKGDEVLTQTLKKTALFLPLVPVIGFWLSGSWVTTLFGESEASSWTFIQGKVSYQVLLVAAAVYYGVISFLWKSGRARLVSIVIGNAALWVILVQTPNWDFLSHPQAWLIPPALCVLAATHFHRKALGNKTAAGIRYAATLTIYITSTADMLIQGIGETIWGPIVLIALAMLGAAAGVALRVRPFLYLGTTFVFIGVTSMVWHAQTHIGAVWPWWVFGISTGVMLMSGLMAIEKNKPKLKAIAASMQQWET